MLPVNDDLSKPRNVPRYACIGFSKICTRLRLLRRRSTPALTIYFARPEYRIDKTPRVAHIL